MDQGDSAQLNLSELQKIVDDQAARLRALEAQVERLASRDAELREMLLDAHDELVRRDTMIRALQSWPPARVYRGIERVLGSLGRGFRC